MTITDKSMAQWHGFLDDANYDEQTAYERWRSLIELREEAERQLDSGQPSSEEADAHEEYAVALAFRNLVALVVRELRLALGWRVWHDSRLDA